MRGYADRSQKYARIRGLFSKVCSNTKPLSKVCQSIMARVETNGSSQAMAQARWVKELKTNL